MNDSNWKKHPKQMFFSIAIRFNLDLLICQKPAYPIILFVTEAKLTWSNCQIETVTNHPESPLYSLMNLKMGP